MVVKKGPTSFDKYNSSPLCRYEESFDPLEIVPDIDNLLSTWDFTVGEAF